MSIRVAINGYGRIGRNILRVLYETGGYQDVELVAINNRADIDACVHLTRYDTTHGRFNASITTDHKDLIINGHKIKYFSETDPANLPWGDLGVDVVLECTGKFNSREQAKVHLQQGASKVLLSAPGEDVDATVVYGVNHDIIKAEDTLVSNASCTTNCLVPVVKVLQETVGIERGLITTIHAYTNDQVLIDANHKDLRRARSATTSMIPTKTGAAKAVGLVLPEMAGKLHGYAMRVPVLNVSVVDLTFDSKHKTSVSDINHAMRTASQNKLKGILQYNDEPLVSCDINHNSASAVYDATLTQVMQGTLVKVLAWYDNEWGYSNRMLDTAMYMAKLK